MSKTDLTQIAPSCCWTCGTETLTSSATLLEVRKQDSQCLVAENRAYFEAQAGSDCTYPPTVKEDID